MKKNLLFFLFISVFICTGSYAQSELKIGYANADSILLALPETKVEKKKLETYGKKLTDQLKNQETELKTKYAGYQQMAQDSNTIPTILQEKGKEIQKLEQNYREFQQKAQSNLAKREQEILRPLYKKVEDGIKDVAKERNYTYIFSNNVFLYAEESENITDLVIKKLLASGSN